MLKSLGISRGDFPKSPAIAFAFQNHCRRNAEDKLCPKKKCSGFIRCLLRILPRDVGPCGLPKRVTAHQARIGVPRGIGKSYTSSCCQLTPKPLNPPPHDSPTAPVPPFSFSTNLLLTGEPLKCRLRAMKSSICTTLEGGGAWTASESFITYMHLFVPYPPEPASCECTIWAFLVCASVACTPPSFDCLLLLSCGWLFACCCYAPVQLRITSQGFPGKYFVQCMCTFNPLPLFVPHVAFQGAEIVIGCQVVMGTRRIRSRLRVPDHANPQSTHPRGRLGTGHASPANAQHR